jgi:transposase
MLCVGTVEDRVPKGHPLRAIKGLADECLKAMDAQFDAVYALVGRPSVPPERLLKGQLLIALYSVRSERQLCEQLEYNLLFRWFLDMDLVEAVFDATSFTQNRDRLLASDVAREFLQRIVELARGKGLMSPDHFSVDGSLIEAWASHKSFRPKDEDDNDNDDNNRWSSFKGEKRSNETHESKTDPDSRLARKSNNQAAKLCYSAHALMENRNGVSAARAPSSKAHGLTTGFVHGRRSNVEAPHGEVEGERPHGEGVRPPGWVRARDVDLVGVAHPEPFRRSGRAVRQPRGRARGRIRPSRPLFGPGAGVTSRD